jgi:hypothetical protein
MHRDVVLGDERVAAACDLNDGRVDPGPVPIFAEMASRLTGA